MSTTDTTPEGPVPLDKLAKIYRKMRDKKQELQSQLDAQIATIEAQMRTIETAMKDQMLAAGVTSVRTDQGTVVLSTRTRYSVQDWDAFNRFVIEHEALNLFEKRIAQGNMAEFLKDNPDTPVPSLQSSSEYAVSVRKPTAK